MDKPRRGVRWSDLPALPLPDLGDYMDTDCAKAWADAHRDHPGFDAEAEECRSCRDGLESGADICKRLGRPDDCTCWIPR